LCWHFICTLHVCAELYDQGVRQQPGTAYHSSPNPISGPRATWQVGEDDVYRVLAVSCSELVEQKILLGGEFEQGDLLSWGVRQLIVAVTHLCHHRAKVLCAGDYDDVTIVEMHVSHPQHHLLIPSTVGPPTAVIGNFNWDIGTGRNGAVEELLGIISNHFSLDDSVKA
jgi:hypothetical protein